MALRVRQADIEAFAIDRARRCILTRVTRTAHGETSLQGRSRPFTEPHGCRSRGGFGGLSGVRDGRMIGTASALRGEARHDRLLDMRLALANARD